MNRRDLDRGMVPFIDPLVEMTDLLVDLQNARLAKVNLDEAVEKAKKAADETINSAQAAYLKRLRELQKDHKM